MCGLILPLFVWLGLSAVGCRALRLPFKAHVGLAYSPGGRTDLLVRAAVLVAFWLILGVVLAVSLPEVATNAVSVAPGFPAEKAGLLDGDRIVGAEGKTVDDFADLIGVADKEPGANVELLVSHDGTTRPVKVTLDERKKLGVQAKLAPPSLGARLEALTFGPGQAIASAWGFLFRYYAEGAPRQPSTIPVRTASSAWGALLVVQLAVGFPLLVFLSVVSAIAARARRPTT